MNIAILGYGKMGREIEKIAVNRGHAIVLKANKEHPFLASDLKDADVAIEFSEPKSAVENIYKCFEAKTPVVVGTTGWYNRFPEVRDECLNTGNTMFYATNFSLGVNLFFKINEVLAKMMANLDSYDPSILEIHHTEKRDSPSGTAITLAETILDELKRKSSWANYDSQEEDELNVNSLRSAGVPGLHEVVYTSSNDVISIKHEAKNRLGFALGAVKAAEWVKSRKGVHNMNDLLDL